jgi:hypothetical protein
MSYRLHQPNRSETAIMTAISSDQLTLFECATTPVTPSPLPAEAIAMVGPLLQALLSGITAADASTPPVAAADEPAS